MSTSLVSCFRRAPQPPLPLKAASPNPLARTVASITTKNHSVLTTQKVLRAAAAFQIPVYATTQNRARLGDTVPEIAAQLTEPPADKTLFSMWIPALVSQLPSSSSSSSSSSTTTTTSPPPQLEDIVLVGIESHICITQTALDARRAGHRVWVLADGVSSCNREEVPLALARLRAEGVVVASSESWLYEVVGDAALPEFKSLIGVVKDAAPDTRRALAALAPVPGGSGSSKI